MNTYDELRTYNGVAEHDMWEDWDKYENTNNHNVLDKTDVDNLNDYVLTWNDL